MLDAYRKHRGSWEAYGEAFLNLMAERQVEEAFSPLLFDIPAVLLCSEDRPDRCHRRLVLEYLRAKWGALEIIHL